MSANDRESEDFDVQKLSAEMLRDRPDSTYAQQMAAPAPAGFKAALTTHTFYSVASLRPADHEPPPPPAEPDAVLPRNAADLDRWRLVWRLIQHDVMRGKALARIAKDMRGKSDLRATSRDTIAAIVKAGRSGALD